jgi:hypothetical protein
MTVRLEPISDADVPAVADFLHANLNDRVSADAWAGAMKVPWKVDAPNYGFMLLDGEDVVGVYLAFYSERMIDGRPERFCNLGAWCVLPDHRLHSVRLLKAMLGQAGYHFTDLSPSGAVIPLNTRLKFRFLDTAAALVPNVPWLSWPGTGVVSSDPAVLEDTLTGDDLALYHDHVDAAAARHTVLIHGTERCYVISRHDRRKDLPLFMSVLYVSNPALFTRMAGRFYRHMLIRHRALATLVEPRMLGRRPRLSYVLRSPRPKMFRSDRLAPEHVDYLYSELVCVAW